MVEISKPRQGRYVLEDHGFELRLVAVDEIVVLEVDDGLHRRLEGVVALLERLDEPFGGIYPLLDEHGGLLDLGVAGGLGGLQDIRILFLDLDLRHRKTGHRQQEAAVRRQVQHEIGHDLLRLVRVGIVHLPAGRRIELADPFGRRLELVFVDHHAGHDLLEMLGRKVREIIP